MISKNLDNGSFKVMVILVATKDKGDDNDDYYYSYFESGSLSVTLTVLELSI